MIKREYGENTTLETRAEANETVDRNKRYQQILEVMQEVNIPLTAKEVAIYMNYRGYIPTTERNFTAPRLTELCKLGKVEPVGRKKCSQTGKNVTVYALREVE